MYFINSYFTVAIYLAVATSLFLAIFHWRNLLVSESRLQRMMECCGVDQNTAEHADQLLKVDMRAARSRCRHCPATTLCDHWLNEEAATSNNFCPNAEIFRAAAAASRA